MALFSDFSLAVEVFFCRPELAGRRLRCRFKGADLCSFGRLVVSSRTREKRGHFFFTKFFFGFKRANVLFSFVRKSTRQPESYVVLIYTT